MVRFATIPFVTLLAATCGCASVTDLSDSLNPFVSRPTFADATNPAVEMACVWQPGEGRGGHGVPARGFSGQIFFFTSRDAEPVIVDGSVRIYLFADRGTPEERAKPLQQFDYASEAWAAHATMASLGPGYSVFVPYPQIEAYQVRCQLRARFTPSYGGPPVWSEAVTMVLDGPPQPGAEPAWWTNIDRSNAPPTVANYDISHKRGTLEQLNGGEEMAGESPRTLRTDTFPLGAVRPVAYETPVLGAQAAAAPRSRLKARPAPGVVDEPGIPPTQSHPLTGGDALGPASHPLNRSTSGRPAKRHPLEQAPIPEMSTLPVEGTQAQPSTASRFQLAPPASAAQQPLPSGTEDLSSGSPTHPLAE
ncbi:MAG: hypothetical protein WBC44_02455 [Planctomycetaceae bacterium]